MNFVCGDQLGASLAMIALQLVGTKTQKAKGIPDNAEIFTQDTRENSESDTKGPNQTPGISHADFRNLQHDYAWTA